MNCMVNDTLATPISGSQSFLDKVNEAEKSYIFYLFRNGYVLADPKWEVAS